MTINIDERSRKRDLMLLFTMGFFFSLHLASTTYINSSFIARFIGEKFVGLFYAVSSVIVIIALEILPKILESKSARSMLEFFLLLNVALLAITSVSNSKFAGVALITAYITLNTLVIYLLDILIESFSKKGDTGKIRGKYLAILNGAWVLAPIAMGAVLEITSFKAIYFFAMLILLIALFFVAKIPKLVEAKYERMPIREAFKKIFKNKAISRIFIANFALQFFYSWMVIYTPIYLFENMGFSWSKIGIIFSVMLLPFALIQYPLGKRSDKVGEKKMMIAGFAVITIATGLLYFIAEPSIALWAFALFATRMGAATIEVMSDTFFFNTVSEKETRVIGLYRSIPSFAYIIGPLVATVFLYFFGLKEMFIALAIFMALGLLNSIKIKDIHEHTSL